MYKQLKVGVYQGHGSPPGYRWKVLIHHSAYPEAREFLSDDQYQHIAMQVKELAKENDPTHPTTCSVDAIEDFHELRDKGGILGNLNVRVFFSVDKAENAIVILGAIIKQNDGPTPLGDKRRISRRRRRYFNGEFGKP